MSTKKQTQISKDLANKKMVVVREFDADPLQVWDAWTKSELLDQWWAPKPWKAETVSMNFNEGGMWLYCMVGPEGERHYARADYKKIDTPSSFSYTDSFCDEKGTVLENFPGMFWSNQFSKTTTGTKVTIDLTFQTIEAFNKIMEMGFEEGFSMGLDNLDELLAK